MEPNTYIPLVSIILPTYNRAGFILETIAGIRDQTYLNWELIIVDDGSDDNTEELVLQLKDPRIFFLKAGRIGINGVIKNAGLRKANGEMIAFIDSDDLWAPGKLEKQVAALLQNPGAGFSMTGGYTFRDPGQPIQFFYPGKKGMFYGNIFNALFRSEIAAYTQVLMIRKTVLAQSGFFKEEKSFSDIDFIVALAEHFPAVILYEPLFYRRLHDSNYITPNWIKSYEEGIVLIQSYKKSRKLTRPAARDALFRIYIHFGEKHLGYHHPFQAITHFLHAWKYKPQSIVPFKKTGKAVLSFFRK